MIENPTLARLSMAITENAELVAAWQRTSGEPGDAIADILAAEMERREVAF